MSGAQKAIELILYRANFRLWRASSFQILDALIERVASLNIEGRGCEGNTERPGRSNGTLEGRAARWHQLSQLLHQRRRSFGTDISVERFGSGVDLPKHVLGRLGSKCPQLLSFCRVLRDLIYKGWRRLR
jgi:hypothetical protein